MDGPYLFTLVRHRYISSQERVKALDTIYSINCCVYRTYKVGLTVGMWLWCMHIILLVYIVMRVYVHAIFVCILHLIYWVCHRFEGKVVNLCIHSPYPYLCFIFNPDSSIVLKLRSRLNRWNVVWYCTKIYILVLVFIYYSIWVC